MTETTFSDDPEKFYDSARTQFLTGLFWPDLVALESAGRFPARVSGNGDVVWRKADVDAWVKDRKR